VLKLSGAQMGTLSANGVVEANEPQAGTALVSFVDTQGISGSGEVVKITFNVLGTTGAYSPLTLQARAYDLDLKDVPVAAQSGSVTVGGGKSGIETAVIVLSVGIGAFFYGRRRN
jgi:hypothetical protein